MSLLHADVAVVGNELCGYAAAALLAHANRRVIILDDDEGTDARPLGDRLVPLVPTLWRVPTSGPAGTLVDQLGLRQRARHELGEPVGVGLIDDPDVRLVMKIDADARKKELERVFREAADAMLSALEGFRSESRDCLLEEAALLHEDGFFAGMRAKKRLEAYGPAGQPAADDPNVRALSLTGIGSALPYVAPFVQSLSRPALGGMGGWVAAWQLAGGTIANTRGGLGLRAALRELLADVVQGHGGEILDKRKVTSVEGDGKRVTIVRTDGANDYAVRAVVDATSRRSLADRLPEGKRREKYRSLDATVPLDLGAAIVRWLLPTGALPRGMPPRAVVLPEDEGGAPMLVGVFDGLPAADGRKKPDDDLVAVVALARAALGESARVADEVEARLEALMPFARGSVVAHDHITGDDAAYALPAFRSSEEAHLLGGRRPSTPFANVARAGRDVAPVLGVEGELAVARSVAALVQQALGKPQGA